MSETCLKNLSFVQLHTVWKMPYFLLKHSVGKALFLAQSLYMSTIKKIHISNEENKSKKSQLCTTKNKAEIVFNNSFLKETISQFFFHFQNSFKKLLNFTVTIRGTFLCKFGA